MALFHRRSESVLVVCKAGDGQRGAVGVGIRVEIRRFLRLQAAFEVLAICFPVQPAKRHRAQIKADFPPFYAVSLQTFSNAPFAAVGLSVVGKPNNGESVNGKTVIGKAHANKY